MKTVLIDWKGTHIINFYLIYGKLWVIRPNIKIWTSLIRNKVSNYKHLTQSMKDHTVIAKICQYKQSNAKRESIMHNSHTAPSHKSSLSKWVIIICDAHNKSIALSVLTRRVLHKCQVGFPPRKFRRMEKLSHSRCHWSCSGRWWIVSMIENWLFVG